MNKYTLQAFFQMIIIYTEDMANVKNIKAGNQLQGVSSLKTDYLVESQKTRTESKHVSEIGKLLNRADVTLSRSTIALQEANRQLLLLQKIAARNT